MTIKEAYNIQRRYKTTVFNYPPHTIENLFLRVYKHTVEVGSPIFDVVYKKITKKQFNKTKENFNLEFKYSYDKYDEYILDEKVYLTSLGIISQEDFLLSKDIMDNLKTIPKKELKEDIKYIGHNGKEYFYIKSEKGNLYDIKLKKQILKDSIRIVEEGF